VTDDSRLERAIAGALRAAIHDHGPITAEWIGSAVKRIVGNLRNAGLAPEERSAEVKRRRRKGVAKAPR
jgi:hypothetical protein